MEKSLIDIDIASREKIIHDISNNYFVEAGAGSGKTTVLVKRMVAMVEKGIDISKICAITFTKAAANEFYLRLQNALSLRAQAKTIEDFEYDPFELDNPSDISRSRCKKALQDIDLAFMGTIDAFCMMILKEHPGAINIPYKTNIIDDKALDAILVHEFKNIELGLYGEELKQKALLFSKYHKNPVSAFSSIYKACNNNRTNPYHFDKYFKEELPTYFNTQIFYFKKFFEYLRTNQNDILENTKDALNAKIAFDKYYYVLVGDYNNYWLVLNAYRDILNLRIAIDSNAVKLFPDLLQECGKKKITHFTLSDTFKNFYNEIKANQYNLSLSFVLDVMPIILENNKQEGNLSFYDNLLYLKEALYQDILTGGKLIDHLYQRHSYFLIDEFQDTDPLQAQIFFYLASSIKDPDYTKCIPHKGSLFIVGDPKQSIYRFKNADVAQVLKVRSLFKADVGEVLFLYQNFRSASSLRHYFNRTFEKLLPVDTFEQAKFPLIPIPQEDKEGFSGAFSYDLEGDDAVIVKNIIEKLHHDEKHMIFDKKMNKLRMLEYADFMIITPTKTKLLNYTSVLKEANIPFYVEGKFDFKDCKALVNLISFYNVIVSNDNRYLYALLKSDYYNLSENLIYEHFHNHNTDITIKEILDTIISLKEKCQNKNSSDILNILLEELNLFKVCGNENSEYLYFLIEQVIDLEQNKQILNYYDAITYFEEILNENSTERYPDLSYSSDKVHLANLHKVKGLEAACVILACPGSSRNIPDRRIENNETYLLQVENKTGFGTVIKNETFTDIAQAEKISLKEEEKRLVYVAATRARNILISASKKLKDGKNSTSNIWYPLLEGTLDINNELDASSLSINHLEIIKQEDAKYNPLIFNEESKKESISVVIPSKLGEIEYEHNKENTKDNPLLIGTIIHRYLELVVANNFKLKSFDVINAVLNEHGKYHDDYYRNIITKVANTMENGGYPQKEQLADLFTILSKTSEKYTETKFAYKKDDSIYLGVIDLIYKYQDKWYIVDYKTNFDDNNIEEHYAQQLKAYQDAFKENEGIDALTYIYHIEV